MEDQDRGARHFRIDVPQDRIDAIVGRLVAHPLPYRPATATGWKYGMDMTYLAEFVRYWREDYDWRQQETILNRHPQYRCEIDGIDVHYVHLGADRAGCPTLVITHGWPGSTHEFHDAAERIAFPERFGGDAADGLNVILPSLPGFGFSGRPHDPIGPRRVASLWHQLLVDRLGIDRFGLQGGDIGAAVSTWLAHAHPQHVTGLRLNLCQPHPRPEQTPAEAAWRSAVAGALLRNGGYWIEQSTAPETIATVLAHNPVGHAAWVLQRFHAWSDRSKPLEDLFDRDWLITNLMIHLVNDATTSMIWMYYGAMAEAEAGYPDVRVPSAMAIYPDDWLPWPPRAVVERYYDVRRWREMPGGGHFAALERPAEFATDVLEFFGSLPR